MKTSRQRGRSSLELLEEATDLVRSAPAATLACYYLGALPFVLGGLYFWSDMSRSPFAGQHQAESALGLAALFIWMKCWQAAFARRLRARLLGEAPMPLSWGQRARVLLSQAALQPTGLFLLPVALVCLVPFPWTYAFYQNLTALAEAEDGKLRTLVRHALRQALRWPASNLLLVGLMSGFGLIVLLNLGIMGFLLPSLLKMLLGIESVFTRSGTSVLNTTFAASALGLTYLCVDPLLKALYVLRCFYGESLQTGADLKAELNQVTLGRLAVWGVILAVLFGPTLGASARQVERHPSRVEAQGSAAAPKPPNLSPEQLEQSMAQVIQQRKFTWRMPREKAPAPEDNQPGPLARFLERVRHLLSKWARAVWDWLDSWLRKLFNSKKRPAPASGFSWMVTEQMLLYGLIAVVILGLALFLVRVWQHRQPRPATLASEPLQPAPDLRDENVSPDQLPEDGWLRMGRELLDQGEWRLALRAFYLASLVHLASRNLIRLAKFKSNRDYERELNRRAHSLPQVSALFAQNVATFDAAWYGLHALDREGVCRFAANVDQIRSGP